MNLKQLEVFRAVMASGSTMGAASVLQLSQSAVSRQLTGLEEEIGFELFIRDKGRLVPRPEAHALIGEVEELSDMALRVRRRAADLKAGAGQDTLLRVAFAHSMVSTILPRVVSTFLADRPKVVVEILSGPYDAIERMVMGRVADLGFARLQPEENSFRVQPILRGGISCVIRKGHPMAEKQTIGLQDLSQSELILLGRQRTRRNELEHALRTAGARYRCRIEVHSAEAACALAAEGLGIAIVPTMIACFFTHMDIELRPFSPQRYDDYGIISLPDQPLSRAAEAFIDIFRSMMLEAAGDTLPL